MLGWAVERPEGESGTGEAERERTGGEHETGLERDTLERALLVGTGAIGARRGGWAMLFFVIVEAVTQEERDFCGEVKGS